MPMRVPSRRMSARSSMPTSNDALWATKMLPRASASSSASAGRNGPAPARSRSRMPVIWVMRGGIGMPGSTRREIRATCSSPSSRTAPISTMRALAPTPVVSRSTTVHEAEPERCTRLRGQPDEADAAVVAAHEAGVVLHDLLEHPPGKLARHARQGQERTGRPFGGQRLSALLDQRCEPVSRPQLELERRSARAAEGWCPPGHTNVCSQIGWTPPRQPRGPSRGRRP